MDNESLKDVLRETTVFVLETAALLFVDDQEMELSDCIDTDMFGGEIIFNGFKNGRVMLWMTKETADSTAGNMLGIDSEIKIEDKQRTDAMLEILNMITGNLLTNLFGDQAIFQLDTPQLFVDGDISENWINNSVIISAENKPVVIAIDVTE